MIHVVHVLPDEGFPYLAAITRHNYLADLIVNAAKWKIKGSLSTHSVQLDYPLYIREIDHSFEYLPEKLAKPLKRKDGILYRLDRDWFPTKLGEDEMGVLNHEHFGPETQFESCLTGFFESIKNEFKDTESKTPRNQKKAKMKSPTQRRSQNGRRKQLRKNASGRIN